MASVASKDARNRETTPSPPSETVRTPPAPRFGGFEDRWVPYSPRKSARIAQRAQHRTPSPPPSHRKITTVTGPLNNKSKITKSLVSPKKKSQYPATPRKTSNSCLTLDPATLASGSKAKENSTAYMEVAGMPTPAKTPRKTPTKDKEIDAISRNLFAPTALASPDATPARRRKVKKYTGTSLDSMNELIEEEPIPIFTDVGKKSFVVENAVEGPFLRKTGRTRAAPETPRRRSKRKCVVVPGEGRLTVEEAMKREDGIIYTFRGKKFLRKFEADENDDGIRTRSGLKPRLLFPPKKSEPSILEDEEADTDVEDHIKNEVIVEDDEEEEVVSAAPAVPATPTKPTSSSAVRTPKATHFDPMTPPLTKRINRAADKLETGPIRRSAVFEQWRNTGTKRRASDDEEVQQPVKRARI